MSRKVLVIDDAREVLTLAGVFLRAGRWDVVTAQSGEEGIEAALAHRPDVVLIDVRMPGLDGMATLQRIRALDPAWSPACAFVTASPEDLDPATLARLHVPVIPKPFRAATFEQLVAALLGPPP